MVQVQYLECVDVMLSQLVRRLHEAEAAGHGQYAVCVTGDHSTPVLFGDHSHEPVPLAIAHVRHVVSSPYCDSPHVSICLLPLQFALLLVNLRFCCSVCAYAVFKTLRSAKFMQSPCQTADCYCQNEGLLSLLIMSSPCFVNQLTTQTHARIFQCIASISECYWHAHMCCR